MNRPAADDLCVRVSALHRSSGDSRRPSASLVRPLLAYAREHAVQLAHFVGVGACLAALNLLLLYWFRTRLHLSDPLAITAMYSLGTVPHFIYHRWITYRAQDLPVVPQGMRYVIMLISNFVVIQGLVGLAARASLSPYIAVIASNGCTMVANFLMLTHVVFVRGRGRA
jgi:putative flippase GtrA